MANLSLFDPMSTQMSKLLQSFGLRPGLLEAENRLEMKIDLSEDDKSYIVRADIPGVKKEDIHIDLDGNRVSISAEVKTAKEEKKNETVIHTERYEGKVFRSFTLSSNIDESKAEAVYKDGVLQLTLPKLAGGTARRISIS
jgi:HSP20 family protein